MTDSQRARSGRKGGGKKTDKTKLRGFGRQELTKEQRREMARHAAERRWNGEKRT